MKKNTKISFDSSFNFLDFKDNEANVLFIKMKITQKPLSLLLLLFFVFKDIYIIQLYIKI